MTLKSGFTYGALLGFAMALFAYGVVASRIYPQEVQSNIIVASKAIIFIPMAVTPLYVFRKLGIDTTAWGWFMGFTWIFGSAALVASIVGYRPL